MGQFITGSLFPEFKTVTEELIKMKEYEELKYFHKYFERRAASHFDYAKAVVWAFIAGFSERLVPDFLHTLRPRLKVSEIS